jgi:bifunctional DNA-binding transcriptional regulator/antitoxin component of YhaV-PrlF toxin-antitoxin module
MRQKKPHRTSSKHKLARPRTPQGLAEEGLRYDVSPSAVRRVELGAGGRLVIPARMRAALDMKVGDLLTIRLEHNELRIYSYAQGIRRIQDVVAKRVPEGVGTVEEFVAERRREAARELKEIGDD